MLAQKEKAALLGVAVEIGDTRAFLEDAIEDLQAGWRKMKAIFGEHVLAVMMEQCGSHSQVLVHLRSEDDLALVPGEVSVKRRLCSEYPYQLGKTHHGVYFFSLAKGEA